MKTSNLEGLALDWAVAKCEGKINEASVFGEHWEYSPSTDWALGGLIIEREDISFRKYHNPSSAAHGIYYAKICRESGAMVHWSKLHSLTGATALIAAMRCYVASKLGDEVEIPATLLNLVSPPTPQT